MAVARHDPGPVGAVRALASQVHPVFMLPPLATSWFGAVLGGLPSTGLAVLHAAAAFFALYTAHVTDGYVDFHVRAEDDDHPLTARGCWLALAGASMAFFICLGAIVALVDVWAGLLTLPGWLIAVNHAPQLDTNPVGATAGYPLGIGFALLGGYYVQATTLGPTVLALAAVFVTILSGIKVIDDAQDYDYDSSIDKRTVAVVLGPTRARLTAFGLMIGGMVAVVALALALPGIPPAAGLAAVAFGAVAAVAWRADPETATMLLIRGSYLFLAVLVAAVWFRPLA
ncbi:MAG: ubiquinone biosynthesis protein UbiA [Halobacteriales archaeon SW_9_67_25]|jgi:4-hydroxybenzoate polyprenyltransferase|nr:MAG: ubiquinone biosynthesis protein UbiA [Halobacteriales archaeon SW_9_67_25]